MNLSLFWTVGDRTLASGMLRNLGFMEGNAGQDLEMGSKSLLASKDLRMGVNGFLLMVILSAWTLHLTLSLIYQVSPSFLMGQNNV